MNWFFRLSPDIQAALALYACGTVFNCGVWWATIRSLKQAVIECKKKQAAHDAKFENHGERITTLETLEHARSARHGGTR